MDRQEIARCALEETQRNSFEKMSMQSLADKIGVKKASFYHHFPSKKALAVAVTQEAQALLTEYFAYFDSQSATQQLDAYIRIFSKHMRPIENLCPGAGFVATWPNQSDDVKRAVSELYQTHQSYLVNVINAGKVSGDFDSAVETNQVAESVFCLLQGSLLAARVTNSTEVFTGVRHSIFALVGGAHS
jgi:TetR/AcrR family transcriptional repressor of nem operon